MSKPQQPAPKSPASAQPPEGSTSHGKGTRPQGSMLKPNQHPEKDNKRRQHQHAAPYQDRNRVRDQG